jgi:uncharacterized protein (TIGR02145 family)
MKTIIIILCTLLISININVYSQVAINTYGSSPDPSAMLDVQSTTKGVLLPRLTNAERDAIAAPVAGLVIYNTDVLGFQIYDGEWNLLTSSWNCGEPIFDEQNNKYYSTIQIGTQCWMVENLASTKYNDGTDIPLVEDNSAWEALSTPAYCWYINDISHGYTYGGLYNWFAVNTGKLCPTGWHVATDAEWTTLTTYAGGDSIAGGKLRVSGGHWGMQASNNTTNEYKFSAFPGGSRPNGSFYYIGTHGMWWSSTQSQNYADEAWYRVMFHVGRLDVFRTDKNKIEGFSVRCLRD